MKKEQFLLYESDDGKASLEVLFKDENIWASQKAISELFGVDRSVITKHLKNIFIDEELDEKSNVHFLHIANSDKPVKFYSLISVGYRVNSKKATRFRVWATKKIKEFVIKGFSIDSERLKNGEKFGKDYFKELLEIVRSIRSSERRIYQQLTDLFRECSIDYSKDSEITKDFYANVQNKFHYAITNMTAAEIIFANANSKTKNMGLSTWKKSPEGRILKSDAIIAKNYLTAEEIKRLERTVSSFFDYIENIIEKRKLLSMLDLANSVDKFLNFNEFRLLVGLGSISKSDAEEKAFSEYKKFNKSQSIYSDFDLETDKMLKLFEKNYSYIQ
jgi:hypothetical protein